MLQKLNWQAYTNQNRNQITEQVKDAISMSDGCIINFTLFSDLAMSLSIEIEENKIHHLHASIAKIIPLTELDLKQIQTDSQREWLIFLNISFSEGKGDLKE